MHRSIIKYITHTHTHTHPHPHLHPYPHPYPHTHCHTYTIIIIIISYISFLRKRHKLTHISRCWPPVPSSEPTGSHQFGLLLLQLSSWLSPFPPPLPSGFSLDSLRVPSLLFSL